MNWGFLVAWLSAKPQYVEDDVWLNAVMLTGMLWCANN